MFTVELPVSNANLDPTLGSSEMSVAAHALWRTGKWEKDQSTRKSCRCGKRSFCVEILHPIVCHPNMESSFVSAGNPFSTVRRARFACTELNSRAARLKGLLIYVHLMIKSAKCGSNTLLKNLGKPVEWKPSEPTQPLKCTKQTSKLSKGAEIKDLMLRQHTGKHN